MKDADPRNADNHDLIERGLARVYRGRLIPIMRGGEGEDVTPPADERPAWLPEKFANAEALATSYGELERKLGELSQRASQADALEQNYADLAAQVEQMQAQRNAPDQSAEYERWNEAYASDPVGTTAAMTQRIVQQEIQQAFAQQQQQFAPTVEAQQAIVAEQAYNNVAAKYGAEFESHREQLAQAIQANPHLIPEAATRDPRVAAAAIETVYKIVNPLAFVDPSALAPSDEAKRLAQTAVGAGGRPVSPPVDQAAWDQIKAAAPKAYWE